MVVFNFYVKLQAYKKYQNGNTVKCIFYPVNHIYRAVACLSSVAIFFKRTFAV